MINWLTFWYLYVLGFTLCLLVMPKAYAYESGKYCPVTWRILLVFTGIGLIPYINLVVSVLGIACLSWDILWDWLGSDWLDKPIFGKQKNS